jgi:Leucine-rich repeat (LRR) protein
VEIRDLYSNLKEAYTAENLHLISSRIIDFFRQHRYDTLRAIQREVNTYTPCNEEKINRVFSRLIMLYHPDRLNQAVERLEEAFRQGDFEGLYAMSHILNVQHMKPDQVTVSSVLSDDDLAEEFGWDAGDDGYHYFMDREEYDEELEQEMDLSHRSFFSALKQRIYGNLNVDFPMYMLEDLEEIDMADYEIESLEGIEACRFARVVDLTNNNLTDITELRDLVEIERLYLSNNHIGMIDSLCFLENLQVLDISHNDVDDLSPLFDLEQLSYVNVMGNRVPAWQLESLQLKGVTVVH